MDHHSASSSPTAATNERPETPATVAPSLVTPLAQALRFASAGLELSGMALGVAAIGYLIDRHFQHTTLIATAFGTMIGFSAGLYRFIRQALTASQPAAARNQLSAHDHQSVRVTQPYATDDHTDDPADQRRRSDGRD